MDSLSNTVMTRIEAMGRGAIFFPPDLSSTGANSASLRKILERATKDQKILRLATGIYYYPKIDEKYGLGVLYPSYEDVAKRVAERDNVQIVPTGAYAQNMLGLSTQIPMNMVFLTDGPTKTIKFANGHTIKMKHTSQKNFAFINRTLMLLTFALKDLGASGITEEHTARIREILTNIPLEEVKKDLHLMPEWIRSYILEFYEQVF